MYVQTVCGRVSPTSLGVTLSHEHLLLDYRCTFVKPPPEYAHLAQAEITPELISQIRQAPQYSLSNLVLEGDQSCVEDLKQFRLLGGRTVVDLTSFGLGPNPLRLRQISIESQIHVVAGCGYYRHIAQNPSTLLMKADEIADEIVKAILIGIGETGVRAGIIGEIGTSVPLHHFERESLVAAAKAQRQTGAAINIHPDIWGRGHLDIIEILDDAGADLSRVIMSHMDEVLDTDWHCKVSDRGVYLSFDTFGSEFSYDGVEEPRDSDRISCLLTLLEKGYVDRLLVSHDLCYKIELPRYGGNGYCHLLTNIVPKLKSYGVSDAELSKMLVENPARALTFLS